MSADPELKKSVHFEWVIEHVDEHDDIQDHDYGNTLSDGFIKEPLNAVLTGANYYSNLVPRLALIRDYGSDAEGLISRSYAYAYKSNDSLFVLPSETDLGQKIPDRFAKQLQKAQL